MTKIAYPYLPDGREIKYVGPDNEFMQAAMKAREELSTDKKHPTGAVVVKNNTIIGRGANRSLVSFSKILVNTHHKWCLRKVFGMPTGKGYWLCPGCVQPSRHAEKSAIMDATHNGHKVDGADLYLHGHWWCCKPCWDTMLKAGIKNIYLLDDSWNLFNPSKN